MLVAIIGISILAAVIAAVVTASFAGVLAAELTMKNKKSLKMGCRPATYRSASIFIYIILHRRDNYPLY